jgi:hypothetical protein
LSAVTGSLILNAALKILPDGQLQRKLRSLHIDDDSSTQHGQENNLNGVTAFTVKQNISIPEFQPIIIPATAIRKVDQVAYSSGERGDVGDTGDVSKYSMSTQSGARIVSIQSVSDPKFPITTKVAVKAINLKIPGLADGELVQNFGQVRAS